MTHSSDEVSQELHGLLNRGTSWLLTWLQGLMSGHSKMPHRLLLHGVAEAAASLARKDVALDWAAVAVHAYALSASQAAQTSERESATCSAMVLRVWFICHIGPRAGDFILDKQTVLDWFKSSLEFPFERAKEKAGIWRRKGQPAESLSLEDMRMLRLIKNRLAAIELLASCGELPQELELANWLQLRPMLP